MVGDGSALFPGLLSPRRRTLSLLRLPSCAQNRPPSDEKPFVSLRGRFSTKEGDDRFCTRRRTAEDDQTEVAENRPRRSKAKKRFLYEMFFSPASKTASVRAEAVSPSIDCQLSIFNCQLPYSFIIYGIVASATLRNFISLPFNRRAVWLCRGLFHHLGIMNCGMTMVSISCLPSASCFCRMCS